MAKLESDQEKGEVVRGIRRREFLTDALLATAGVASLATFAFGIRENSRAVALSDVVTNPARMNGKSTTLECIPTYRGRTNLTLLTPSAGASPHYTFDLRAFKITVAVDLYSIEPVGTKNLEFFAAIPIEQGTDRSPTRDLTSEADKPVTVSGTFRLGTLTPTGVLKAILLISHTGG